MLAITTTIVVGNRSGRKILVQ